MSAILACTAAGCDAPSRPVPIVRPSFVPPPDASTRVDADASVITAPTERTSTFHVVAVGPASQPFGIHRLGDRDFVVTNMAALARLRGDDLVSDPTMLRGIPPRHFGFSVANRVGGRWPDAIWFDIVGGGGLTAPSSAVYRWDEAKDSFLFVRAQAPHAAAQWTDGRLLALVDGARGAPSSCPSRHFEVLSGSPAPLPQIDPTFAPETFVAFDTGEVIAFGARCPNATGRAWVQTWRKGDRTGRLEELPLEMECLVRCPMEIERGISARSFGDVWISGSAATDGGRGVVAFAHFDGAGWSVVDAPSGTHEPVALSVAPHGEVWLSTYSGLFRRAAGATTWVKTSTSVMLPTGDVEEVRPDGEHVLARADDDVWIVANHVVLRTKPAHVVLEAADYHEATSRLYDLEPPSHATSTCPSSCFVSIDAAPAGAPSGHDFSAARDALAKAGGAGSATEGEATLWGRRHYGAVTDCRQAPNLRRAIAKARGGSAPTVYCREVALATR